MKTYVLLLLVLRASAGNAQTAYVGSSSSDVISTLNEASGAQNSIATAGIFGVNFAVSADGTKAYVQSYSTYGSGTSSMPVVSLATGTVTGAITAVPSPGRPAVSPDGTRLYVFSYSDAILAEIDTASGSLLATAPVGSLSEDISQGFIVVKTDGSEVYAATATSILVLDAQSLSSKATIPLKSQALALSSDGSRLYSSCYNCSTMLSVIDTSNYSVIATVSAPEALRSSIVGLVLSPDNQTIYISAVSQLLSVSTSTYQITAHYPTPALGPSLAVSQDGGTVYTTRNAPTGSSPFPGLVSIEVPSGTVSVIDTGSSFAAISRPAPSAPLYLLGAPPSILIESPLSGTITSGVRPAFGSTSLSVSSSGNMVAGISGYPLIVENSHAQNEAVVSLIDTATHKLEGTFAVPSVNPTGDALPNQIAINSVGSVGYVSTLGEGVTPVIEVFKLPEGTLENTFSIGYIAQTPGIGPLVISPDDSTLYLNDGGSICSAPIAPIGTATCAFIGAGKALGTLQSYTLSPDGSLIYSIASIPIQDGFGAYLFVDEIDAKTLVTKLSTPIPYSDVGPFPYGCQIAYAAGTGSVYISCEVASSQPYSGLILRVNVSDFSVASMARFGYAPTGIAVTPDGTKALVTGSTNGTQVFDGSTLAPMEFIPGGPGFGIVIAPQ